MREATIVVNPPHQKVRLHTQKQLNLMRGAAEKVRIAEAKAQKRAKPLRDDPKVEQALRGCRDA